jgi:hypothetical protein
MADMLGGSGGPVIETPNTTILMQAAWAPDVAAYQLDHHLISH